MNDHLLHYISKEPPSMRLLMIGITAVLIVFAVLQLNDTDSGRWFLIYVMGAAAAALTLPSALSRNAHRLLAVGTMLLMFFYFFGFFKLAPGLGELWWQTEVGREAVGLFVGGFALMPVLSCYSCRLKATRASKDRRAPAVFSSPHS